MESYQKEHQQMQGMEVMIIIAIVKRMGLNCI